MLDALPGTEVIANRRLGANEFVGVHAEYFVEPNVKWSSGPACGMLVGCGAPTKWFAPFVHSELPGELAKLRTATDADILVFAERYGQLGFQGSHNGEWLEWGKVGRIRYGGDPLEWIRAHGRGAHICLEITEALSKKPKESSRRLEALIKEYSDATYGVPVGVYEVAYRSSGSVTLAQSPEQDARSLRREIINRNLRGVQRYVSVDSETKRDRSYFHGSVSAVVYWHLANLIDQGTVKRCEAEGCGAVFIQDDPRRRHCPPQWGQQESPCALRQRQRNRRRSIGARLQRIATDGETARPKAAQVQTRTRKNARQSTRGTSGR